MNSVLEIGENIMFLHQGLNAWQGDRQSIITTDAKAVTEFVYASKFMKDYKTRMK
jgi:phospholipid/cholesterol/gamma-HCH transport system ATP-binding protein